MPTGAAAVTQTYLTLGTVNGQLVFRAGGYEIWLCRRSCELSGQVLTSMRFTEEFEACSSEHGPFEGLDFAYGAFDGAGVSVQGQAVGDSGEVAARAGGEDMKLG